MIKAGMTVAEAIGQLTRGFIKMMGRNPDGLEKIKIKQEAIEKLKNLEKVVDLEGNVIDQSKGIIGGKQVGMFDNIFNRMQKDMGRGDPKIVKSKKPDPEEKAMGGRAGFSNGGIDILKAEDKAFQNAMDAFKYYQKMGGKKNLKDYLKEAGRFGDQFRAEGGRIGLKTGMSRRAFLKLMGAAGAGIGALKTGILKLAGKEGARQVTKQIIKTDPVAGKPEWFDALVTKVINEGNDVTKRFATGERQTVHMKKLDDDTTVMVTQDLDDGAIRVEYESPDNVFGDPVQLQYRKELPDEGNSRPTAEFTTAESGPVGRQQTPDDYDIEIDEVGGNSIEDLTSDLSKLKEYAVGKKPTLKEFVQNKKRKDKAKRITEDPEARMDDIIRRQGEMLDDQDFASGGLAGMLGE